jgi:hypothetical protein
MGQTVAAGNSAVGNLNSTVNSMMTAQGTPAQWAGTGLNAGSSAVQAYLGDANARMSGYNANMQAQSGLWQGIGTAGGMAAAAFI